jgi:hypothetical protein
MASNNDSTIVGYQNQGFFRRFEKTFGFFLRILSTKVTQPFSSWGGVLIIESPTVFGQGE